MLWILLSFGSAIAFALKDILAKREFREQVSPYHIVIEQYFFAIIFVVIFFLLEFFGLVSPLALGFSGFSFIIHWQLLFSHLWYFFILKGIFLILTIVLYYILVYKYEISLASPIINLSPVTLLVFSSMFLSESVSLRQLSGIGVIILATYLLEYYTFKRSSSKINSFISSPRDIVIALVLITVFSLNAVTDKYLIQQGSTASTNIFYAGLFTLFLAILLSFKNKDVFPKTSLYPTFSRFLISFCAVLSDYLITLALAIPTALASLIVPLRRTSTFFSSLIGGMIFKEEHLLWKGFCIIVMLIGVLLIVL